MVYKFECSKTGMDCDFTADAPTKEELMQKIATHAKGAHQIETISPELAEKVEGAITEEIEEPELDEGTGGNQS